MMNSNFYETISFLTKIFKIFQEKRLFEGNKAFANFGVIGRYKEIDLKYQNKSFHRAQKHI